MALDAIRNPEDFPKGFQQALLLGVGEWLVLETLGEPAARREARRMRAFLRSVKAHPGTQLARALEGKVARTATRQRRGQTWRLFLIIREDYDLEKICGEMFGQVLPEKSNKNIE